MKNEDRILELLAETLQRIDRHNEQIRIQGERLDRLIEEMSLERELAGLQREEMSLQREEMKLQREEMNLYRRDMSLQREEMKNQQEATLILLRKMQQHDDRLDRHENGIDQMKERTKLMQESALEQQKGYREMTELLMFHNKALREKNIL